jgi:hypothetical protein
MSRGSSVGKATGYGLDDRGIRIWVLVGLRILSSPYSPDRLCSNQPPIQWVRGLFPRGKRQKREADHSPPTTAEVKKSVDLYIYSPIRLPGVVFTELSTRTTFPLILHAIQTCGGNGKKVRAFLIPWVEKLLTKNLQITAKFAAKQCGWLC